MESLSNIRSKTIPHQDVEVDGLNTKTNEIKSFSNQREAGEFLGITRQAVYNVIKRGSSVKEIYIIIKK